MLYFEAMLPNRCIFTDKLIQACSALLVLSCGWRRSGKITFLICLMTSPCLLRWFPYLPESSRGVKSGETLPSKYLRPSVVLQKSSFCAFVTLMLLLHELVKLLSEQKCLAVLEITPVDLPSDSNRKITSAHLSGND